MCVIPHDLESVTDVGAEVDPRAVGVEPEALEQIWQSLQSLYRTRLYPAIQVCIRREGQVVLHRAMGHSHGNAPHAPAGMQKIPVSIETPFCLYSAAKAVTALLIHKLDEQRLLHLDDRICDYIPEFGRRGKEWITLRHVLSHRAGIPNLPPEALDLDLVAKPDRVLEILCELPLRWRPGRWLGYHAITGGFLLGEVVRRVSGRKLRDVLAKEILDPLGLRWTNYGVSAEDVEKVAENAFTGFPAPPPLSTAFEIGAFFQCLVDAGMCAGVRVFDPRTIRHAITEQSFWELDLTLGFPFRYSVGLMLGNRVLSIFGPDTPAAFGHIGFSNILCWADPERRLSVALLTSGKPVANPEVVRLFDVLRRISSGFPKISRGLFI